MKLRLLASLATVALLAGCGGASKDEAAGEGSDTAMADGQNADGQGQTEIDRSPDAIEAARGRAAELVGGPDNLVNAPAATAMGQNAAPSQAMVAAARAAVAPGGENCGEKVEYASSWAAKLPAAFPVYPRSSTKEAAGTDEGSCALRVVSFVTPVALDEVLAFYYTRARSAGFSVEHVTTAGDNVLSGTKGDSAYVVYGRRLPDGVTEIDLVTTD